MSSNIEQPHFSYPFRFDAFGRAEVVEQDSQEEVLACIRIILMCPYGFRNELPEFGTKDQAFREGIDVNEIATTLDIWEPRADLLIEHEQGHLVGELVEQVRITLRGV